MPIALHVENQLSVTTTTPLMNLVKTFAFYSSPLFEHFDEGGADLKPFCDSLPGGKFGLFFQQMQNLYFYMLMISNNNKIDDRIVRILAAGFSD